jgi:sugar lactone lactonase YvrE
MRLNMLAACFLMALITGCQTAPRADRPLLLWPAPPERPRIQFLAWVSGAEQVVAPRGSFEDFILGEEPAARRRMNKPYGLAVHEGVLYVCDTKDLCVCRMDFKNRTYTTFGDRGPGRLRKPINIAVDALGYKFVADPFRRQIVVFGPDDEYVTAFDLPEPCYPVDVALYENELYVLDNDETCQILVLDRTDGALLRTLGEPGGEPGQFKIPNSLCLDAEGYIYVSDTHNWRVQKLTREGRSVWTKGMPGYRIGQFGRPRGVRVGPNGVLYLVDGATEIVQMFSTDGEKLMYFGGPGDAPGALVLPSSLAVDDTSIPYFKEYLHPEFQTEYLLFVASQYGQHLISVYAFGAFPEGYSLSEAQIAELPKVEPDEGIGPAPAEQPPSPHGNFNEAEPPEEPGPPDEPSTAEEDEQNAGDVPVNVDAPPPDRQTEPGGSEQ